MEIPQSPVMTTLSIRCLTFRLSSAPSTPETQIGRPGSHTVSRASAERPVQSLARRLRAPRYRRRPHWKFHRGESSSVVRQRPGWTRAGNRHTALGNNGLLHTARPPAPCFSGIPTPKCSNEGPVIHAAPPRPGCSRRCSAWTAPGFRFFPAWQHDSRNAPRYEGPPRRTTAGNRACRFRSIRSSRRPREWALLCETLAFQLTPQRCFAPFLRCKR